MATLNFNANEVPEDEGFEPLPPGTYSAQIIESQMKETKAGTGEYLELRIQVLDEPYTGRLVFERLNLINPNDTAVKIAKRKLADICNAVGSMEVEDSEELHNIEFRVQLEVEEGKGDFGPQNRIKKFLVA